MRCLHCGAENSQTALFCEQCGAAPPSPQPVAAPGVPSAPTPPWNGTGTANAPPPPAYSPPPAVAPGPQAVLFCSTGPDMGKQVLIGEQIVTLGTSPQCALRSGDPDAAPEHADFTLRNGHLYFRSHSGAPLFLNGVGQTEGTLSPGVPLQIGRSVWQAAPVAGVGPQVTVQGPNGTWFQTLNQQVGAFTGVGPVEGLDAREMFSSVLEHRTDEDEEDYFMAGTYTTTPPLAMVKAGWPKPWLFFKIFLLSLLVYGGFVFAASEFHNPNCLPGLILIGSFAIPLTVVVFYYEMNVPRNVSFYQVSKAILLGGILSLIVSLFGYGLLGNGLPGVVEEIGKAAALLLFVNKPRYHWTLNGLLLGGAIGAGFAGFESAGYALQTLIGSLAPNGMGGLALNFGAIQQSILLRGVLAPGGHVAWAALEGAALWKVKGDQPFKPAMLTDIRFLRVLGLSMILHTIWDIQGIIPLPFILYLPLLALLILIAWAAILGFIQDGLKQVQEAQTEAARPGVTVQNGVQ